VLDALESDHGLRLGGLRQAISVEHHQTPLDFRDALRSPAGNGFGPEPLLFQSTYFRQHNRDEQIRGLYYVGAGTHPGAGIPGVLMGAGITTRLLVDDLKEAS
jgi:phytoene desaturase